MQDAIDSLITALMPYSCRAVCRQADQSFLVTVADLDRSTTITKVIPIASLQSKATLSAIVKDLQRDMEHAVGVMSPECLADLRIRGARIARFDT